MHPCGRVKGSVLKGAQCSGLWGVRVRVGSSCRNREVWNHLAAPSALSELEDSLVSCCPHRDSGSHREVLS